MDSRFDFETDGFENDSDFLGEDNEEKTPEKKIVSNEKQKAAKKKLSRKARRRRKRKIILSICIAVPLLLAIAVFAVGNFLPMDKTSIGSIKSAQSFVAPMLPDMPKGKVKVDIVYKAGEEEKITIFKMLHPLSRFAVETITVTDDTKDATYVIGVGLVNTSTSPEQYAILEAFEGATFSYETIDGVLHIMFSQTITLMTEEEVKTKEGGVTPAVYSDYRATYDFAITSKGASEATMMEEAKKMIKSIIDKTKAVNDAVPK